jgi:carbon-monoxide dehydrogenase large subunit
VDEAAVPRPGRLVGQPIPRFEDLRFITGRGRYTDDIAVAGAAHAAFVRSDQAHAVIEAIDVAAARAAPGVIGVLTGADYLADGHVPIRHAPIPLDAIDPSAPGFGRETTFDAGHVPLATDRIRHVGEAVAMVVAQTLEQAVAAAELVVVRCRPLPAVTSTDAATAPGAPQLYDDCPGNVCLSEAFGDAEATARAFEAAHLVVEGEFQDSRVVACQMEPRAATGEYDEARGVFRLTSGSQGAVRQRQELAQALAAPIEQVEVICPDTGGGFGVRSLLYVEQLLVVWAARRLGRPVRWTATRSESFLGDYQGRGLKVRARLALDAEGRILALDSAVDGDVGAHTVSYVSPNNHQRIATTVYDIPAARLRVRAILTNTTPTCPYRGAGRPEAHFVIERLIDMAAARLGVDRIELRRRNLIPRARLPYRTAMGLTYDCGDFAGAMDGAMALADWEGFPARRLESEARGRLRGIGLCSYVEAPVGAAREAVRLTAFEDGAVEALAGTQSTGQGHETTFIQVVADLLQVEASAIRLLEGDTRRIEVGGGSHSNRSMRIAGTLLVQACGELIARARAIAAAELGAGEDEISHEDGLFGWPGSNRTLTLGQLCALAGEPLAAGADFFGRIPAHPCGAAVCELEVDPETGAARVLRYSCVDDVGQPINPLIVEGQTHGGIAQGVGQALMEDLLLDPATGQMLGGSFMDYGVPRADDLPSFEVALVEDPSHGNPLRVKGGGESGTTPSLAAVSNALADALSPLGVEHVPLPATPQRIWRMIRQAGRHRGEGNAA